MIEKPFYFLFVQLVFLMISFFVSLFAFYLLGRFTRFKVKTKFVAVASLFIVSTLVLIFVGFFGGYSLVKSLRISSDLQNVEQSGGSYLITRDEDRISLFVDENSAIQIFDTPSNEADLAGELIGEVNMEIIDELEEWYRIVLDSGTYGWISKDDLNAFLHE